MAGVGDMLREARRSLGTRGRPNHITTDYAHRHGSGFLRAAWCNMAVTKWARDSGNTKAVLPGGDRAYTVWHAQDFQKAKRWHPGTASNVRRAKPGDIVFFDWGGTDSVGYIDHVGVVEQALPDGRVQTIEGNTSDACLRRVRSASVIAGYGRPAYTGSPSGGSTNEEDELIGLKKGDQGERVKALQALIEYAGQGKALGKAGVDGEYGDGTAEGLRLVRKSVGSEAKEGYGNTVSGWAYAQLMTAVSRKQSKV